VPYPDFAAAVQEIVHDRKLARVGPFGGLAFIAGWLMLAWVLLRNS
jgi:uncharacterized membrane protein YgdD (TMEM256/DUF423 family)